MENKQLKAVYNGSETIINAGFTMQSNFVVPVLNRMKLEELINDAGATVVQAILSFKHTEACPYPTTKTIASYLGTGEDYVKKALKSIRKSGILIIKKVINEKTGKESRNSKYDFAPFFALIEKFIVEFKHKKNIAVKIADLLKVKVQKKVKIKKKETKDFSWSENYDSETEVVVEKVIEEVAEEVVVPVLPEKLQKLLEANKVSEAGILAVETKYTAYAGEVDDKIFVQKILASVGKDNFISFFNKCIDNAYVNGEKPQETAPASKGYAPKGKVTRTELLPDWFDEYEKESKQPEPKKVIISEELAEKKRRIEEKLASFRKNKEEGVK
jgi:hypothetical protein